VTLRTRVALAVALVTVGALTAASLAVLFFVRRDEMADLDRALSTQAELAARLADMDDPRHPVIEPGRARVPEHYAPSPAYIVVYGPLGRVRTATSTFNGRPPTLVELGVRGPVPHDGFRVDLRVSGEALRGIVVEMPTKGYSLLYAASRREVDTDVAFLARVLGGLLVGVTALTTLIASYLGKRLARDVQVLAGIAREVASGNLDARAGSNVSGSLETQALAADLDHMINKLGVLMVAQRTFISHAAHELRSPLATLRGELQLALRRPHTATEHEETIAQALGDVEALIVLSRDLLTLARAESTNPEHQTTPLKDVIHEALHQSKGLTEARAVRITVHDQGAADLVVVGARRDLARALRNLIDNAVIHSAPAGEVVLRTRVTEREGQVSVEDAGPGVPAEDRASIFDPFFRGARERGETEQGVGLGLAIARQIARRSGGDVALDLEFDPGARFVLTLRRTPPIAEALPGLLASDPNTSRDESTRPVA